QSRFLFFLCRLRPPPSRPLFPYTTLFRSGPGCLLYSLILSMDRAPELQQITPSYRYVARVMVAALADIQPGVELAGSSDLAAGGDRKSTRLNSSHVAISYAVFCLKKKKE